MTRPTHAPLVTPSPAPAAPPRRDGSVRHIALAFPMGLAHLQPLVQGITDYARAHGRWLFTSSPEAVTLSIQSLHGWRGDGVIATLVNPADVRAARQLRVPVVTFAGAMRDPGVPRVMVNNPAVGRRAAEHLLACGFRRFGFYGLRNVNYSQDRGDGFLQHLAEQLGPGRCAVHLSPNSFTAARPWQDEMGRLEQWVARLEPPVGLFAANDQRARMLVDACQRLGLRVPDDAGVLGVDNDLVACEFSDPPLSSIACDWYRIGTESAALLDRLMRSKDESGRMKEESRRGGTSGSSFTLAPSSVGSDRLIDPVGVVRRRSTDVLVVENPGVGRAVQYVREHMAEPFGVEALLREARVSRRSLEQGFKRSLGCTPHAFLCRARVDRARDLLTGPRRMKLTDIARACGFTDLRRFRLVFARCEGMPPAEYRRRHAAAENGPPPAGPPPAPSGSSEPQTGASAQPAATPESVSRTPASPA